MTQTHFKLLLASLLFLLGGQSALAAKLQVRPVLVDVTAPGASSILTLKNIGKEGVNAQIRVFRWSQKNGRDQLVPTRDVVASPPFVKMKPGGTYNLRVIRVSKRPVKGEESYRLIVDQIPDVRVRNRGVAVKFNIRYSIPVFFSNPSVSAPQVSWNYSARGGKFTLSARNNGGRRMRISNLKIQSNSRSTRTISRGLAGYVLAGSSKVWRQSGSLRGARKGVTVSAKGNNVKFRSKAKVR